MEEHPRRSPRRPGVGRSVAAVTLAAAAAALVLAGCAKEPPPGLGAGTTAAPAAGGTQTGGGSAVGTSPANPQAMVTEKDIPDDTTPFRAYYRRHQEGDTASYRVTGNIHRSRKMTVTYHYRWLKLLNGQRIRALGITSDYRDGDAVTDFVFEDQADGRTRAIGFVTQTDPDVRFYDPPPVLLDWRFAAKKGYSTDIPYRAVFRGSDGTLVPSGGTFVEHFTVVGSQRLSLDASGAPSGDTTCLVWRTTGAGETVTKWLAPFGEIAREDLMKGRQRERLDLVGVTRRQS